MGLFIRNNDTVNIEIPDLGLTIAASSTLNLTTEEAGDIAASAAVGGNLNTHLNTPLGGTYRIVVLDPLDDTTPLSPAQGVVALSAANDTHWRIKGGDLNQLDDVSLPLVGSPPVPSPNVSDILQYNGSQWTNVPGDDIGDVDRENLRFVGKHGDDSNDGRTPAKAFLTFSAAIAAVNSGSPAPSTTDRYTILCQDAGTYVEGFTVPGWITIEARSAKVEGTITIEDNCELNIGEVDAPVNTSAIQKLDGTAVSRVNADTLRATGTGNTVVNGSGSPADPSLILLKARQVFVEDGAGILDNSTPVQGHIHIDIEDIYITGTGTCIDRNSSTGYVLGKVAHLLEVGAGIGNGTGIEINTGRVDIVAGFIDTAVAYKINAAGTLRLLVNQLNGTRQHNSGDATVDIVEADVLRWITITSADSPFDVRRIGFISVDTTAGPVTVNLPNPPSDGDNVSFQDSRNNFGTNAATFDAGAGNEIEATGSPPGTQTVQLNVNGTSGLFIYNAAIGRWTFSRIQEEVAFSPDNVIYVTKNGSDIVGDGSFSNPYLTVKKGASEAILVASASNPTTVKVLDGVYDEINPLPLTAATSRWVTVQGSQEQTTVIRPTVNGQALFELESAVSFDGPALSRLQLAGQNNGGTDYRDVAGGDLIRTTGDGTFFCDKVIPTLGNRALNAGNGTITTFQENVLSFASIADNEVAIDAKNTNCKVVGQAIFLNNNDTSVLTADSARVELGNFEIAGADTGQAGTAIDNNDSAVVFANSGYIRNHVNAILANDTSFTRINSTVFEDNTNDLNQVDATALVRIQGNLSKTKQLIMDGTNVSLNYIDTDTGDYIVGNADATGDPGKEFRVRDFDGRVFIGDNATDGNAAANTVGGSRSINLIDENGNFRIWRWASEDGQDPAVEWVKGINPGIADDEGEAPIVSITTATNTVVIDVSSGTYNDPFDPVLPGIDRTTLAERAFPAGREIRINGTAANDGDYVVTSASYTGGSPDPETIEIVLAGSPALVADAGAVGDMVFGGGAGRPDGVSTYVGDPGAAINAGVGNVHWDMFLQEDDYYVIRRRTGGGGGIPDEKLRIFSDAYEFLGSTEYDNGDNAIIVRLETVAGADDYLIVRNSTGSGPQLEAVGADADIDIELIPKGTGTVIMPTGYEANVIDDSLITKIYADNVLNEDLPVVQVRRTTTLALPVTPSWGDVTFDLTDIETNAAVIEHNNTTTQEIDIKEDGLYQIQYTVSSDDEVTCRVVDDGASGTSVIPGSTQLTGDTADVNDVIVQNSPVIFASLTAGDTLVLQVQAQSTAETMQAEAIMTVQKMVGRQGEMGPPGAGSTVNVQEDDALITTADTINFEGNGVSVVGEVGSPPTKATVTIPGNEQSHLFRHNGAVTQTFTAATTINFGTSVRNDSDFTHAIVVGGSEITINTPGWYRITYEVTCDNGGNGRRTGIHELELNAAFVSGSRSNSYHRNATDGRNTASATVVLNLALNDVIRVRSSANASIVTQADSCRLNIESIDAP